MTNVEANTNGIDNMNIQKQSSPMDSAFEKIIAIFLQSNQYHYSQEFLDELTDLTLRFFNDLVDSLSEYTRLQRRQKPSLSDMKLLFNLKGITLDEICQQVTLSNKFQKSQYNLPIKQVVNQIKQVEKQRNNPEIEPDNPSLPFILNQQYEITNLVPRLNIKPSYIPSYLPDFPPDYTYQSTPKYMKTVTDLKELRLKLVSESRMIEKPLYNLIENDDKKWRIKFEQELQEFEKNRQESIAVQVPIEDKPKEVEATEPKLKEESDIKSFDFITYANKRKMIDERHKQEHEARIKARETNLFMKAELYYSPYSTISPTPEIETYFKNVISDGFKDVITSIRRAEQEKKIRIAKLVEERNKRERELEAQRKANEISINFNRMDESSSSSEDEQEDDRVIQFMFDEDKQEEKPESNIVVIGETQPESVPSVSFGDIVESSDDDMEDIEAILEAEISNENKPTESTVDTITLPKTSDEDENSSDDMEDIL